MRSHSEAFTKDSAMHCSPHPKAPAAAFAVRAPCADGHLACAGEPRTVARTLAVAALATACAIVLGLGAPQAPAPAPTAAPGAAALPACAAYEPGRRA